MHRWLHVVRGKGGGGKSLNFSAIFPARTCVMHNERENALWPLGFIISARRYNRSGINSTYARVHIYAPSLALFFAKESSGIVNSFYNAQIV